MNVWYFKNCAVHTGGDGGCGGKWPLSSVSRKMINDTELFYLNILHFFSLSERSKKMECVTCSSN